MSFGLNITLINVRNGLKDFILQTFSEMGEFNLNQAESEEIFQKFPQGQNLFIFYVRPGCEKDLRFILELKHHTMYQDIPILAVSEVISENQETALIQNGASGFLSSPLETESFVGIVGKLLRPAGGLEFLDLDFVNSFEMAAANVFEQTAGIRLQRKNFYLKKDYKMFGYVSGIMGLSGKGQGSVVITLKKEIAKRVVGQMLSIPADEVDDESARDGVGEIVNMIAGNAKGDLSKTSYRFELSVPSIVVGLGHEITHKKGTPCIVVIFETEDHQEIALQVSLATAHAELRSETGG